jgi:PBSX family phage terminase large subunit
VDVKFGYEPFPVHAPFHAHPSRERALFGAFGSGKSYALCAEAIAWCLEQPGIRGLISRRYIPELRDTTEHVFFDILPVELLQAGEVKRMGGHVESFTFPNGSKILFRGLDDWFKHKSLNIGFMAIDEGDEIDEETYMGMSSRIRQRDPTPEGRKYGAKEITKRGIWIASNPAGHNWLWRRFVDPKKRAQETAFFQSTSFDNPFLPPEYLQSLLDFPPEWVKRYVLCQFDDFAGQIYENWGWDTHVVPPFSASNPAPSSIYWQGFDPGTRGKSNAGLWVVIDPATRSMTGVAEYQEGGLAAVRHAAAWRAIEAQHKMNVQWRVSDPNALPVRDRGSNMTLADQYRRLGFNFQLGPSRDKDKIPMLGQLIELGRFKLTTDCPQTFEAIKDYRWEDITPHMRRKGADAPEKPLKKNDHLPNCGQYLSSRWVAPMRSIMPYQPETFTGQVWQGVKKQLRGQRIDYIDEGIVV